MNPKYSSWRAASLCLIFALSFVMHVSADPGTDQALLPDRPDSGDSLIPEETPAAANPLPRAQLVEGAMALLAKQCAGCHNEQKKKGGLDLTSRELLLQGSDYGDALIPGDAEQSRLVQVLEPDADPHMPPKQQLAGEEIALIREWTSAGAPWDEATFSAARIPELNAWETIGPWPSSMPSVNALALSGDNALLAAGAGPQIRILQSTATNLVLVRTLAGPRDAVQSLAWSPDGEWLAVGEYRRVFVYHTREWEPRFELTNLLGRVTALAFTPDSRSLCAADGIPTQSGLARVWNVGDDDFSVSWTAHGDTILDLAVDSPGERLATASMDKTVKVWEIPSGKELMVLEGHNGTVTSLAFKKDGSHLASGGMDHEIKVWNLETREQKTGIRVSSGVMDLFWSGDGKTLLAACENGTIQMCEEEKERPVRSFGGTPDLLHGVAVSSDASWVVGGGQDGSLHFWGGDGKLKEKMEPSVRSPEPVKPAQAALAQAPDETAVGEGKAELRLSFVNDVLPILSKAGCNAGKCHAKPEGQNGFKLSVFAYDPKADYREVVKETRGRRVFPALAAESLLLRKPTLAIPHEGGERFAVGSPFYEAVREWIEQGMTYLHEGEPTIQEVTVLPAEGSYAKGASQSLSVRAHYSDGSSRDVTRLAEFESTEEEIASVDEAGEVSIGSLSGEAVIVTRFMGLVAISKVTVPADRKLPDAIYASLPRNNFIDELAYEHFKKLGLFPSEGCTDAEFLRRAHLDAAGALPSVEEAQSFLQDPDPGKRGKLIEQVLRHPSYADHWAIKWADLIRPNPDRAGVKSVYMLDQWLRESFRANKPYDQLAREILTAKGSTHQYGPAVVFRDRREPAELTTLVSQIFLGVRMECARCHHHPNEKWSQDDFYQLAAFFGEMKRKGTGISPPISGDFEVFYHAPGGSVQHPVTGETMKPKPPEGAVMATNGDEDPRAALADWVCQPDNPFFARAVVNRVWAEFFGRGFVEPVDDFRASNPPVNEPLLDALAADFARNGYDLKHLMRTIMSSHLYQLSSLPNEHNLTDTKNFSRSYRRRLRAEVLLDAVLEVSGAASDFQGTPPGWSAKATWSYKINSEFLDAFSRPNSSSDPPCERETKTSLVQALHMMNSSDLQAKIAHASGRAAKLAGSEKSTKEIVTELYLAAYSRYPSPEELSIAARAYAAADATRQTATEDILWALINSPEFVFNH